MQSLESEVRKALRTEKKGKSLGPGNVSLEFMKFIGDKILKLIAQLFNKMLHGGSIPNEMKLESGSRKLLKLSRNLCYKQVNENFENVIKNKEAYDYGPRKLL